MDSSSRLALYTNWSTPQVISWLGGVAAIIHPYLSKLEEHGVTGRWLQSVTADELHQLGVTNVGHSMVVLHKIHQLLDTYFLFDNETLHSVLFCVSRCCVAVIAAVDSLLYLVEEKACRESGSSCAYLTILEDIQEANLYVLSCIVNLTAAVKKAVSWLERSPFSTLPDMIKKRHVLLSYPIQIIGAAQKAICTPSYKHYQDVVPFLNALNIDMEELIKNSCESITLTLCAMESVQIWKSDASEFGINFHSTSDNIHIIDWVQCDSPAYCTGKISKGDELIEVNDQVIIGWPHRKVVDLIHQHSRRLTMRLRKRPIQTTDFTGVPGAGGRRNRVLAPPLLSSGCPSGNRSTRSGYLFTRTPRRKRLPSDVGGGNRAAVTETSPLTIPVPSALVSPTLSLSGPPDGAAALANSINSESDETSVMNAILSPVCSPSSLSSLSRSSSFTAVSVHGLPHSFSRGESVCDNTAETGFDTATYNVDLSKKQSANSLCRMVSSTPNTPLLMARAQSATVIAATSTRDLTNIAFSRQCSQLSIADEVGDTSIQPTGINDGAQITLTHPNALTHHSVPNRSIFSNLWRTHRRTASGGPILITHACSRKEVVNRTGVAIEAAACFTSPVPQSNAKFQATDKRHRKQVHRTSLEEVSSPRKVLFGNRENTRNAGAARSNLPNVQGWLWLKKPNSFTSKYVKRWCVVVQSVLYYYRSQWDVDPEGLVKILGSVITTKADNRNHRFAFVLTTNTARLIFACETDVDRYKWVTLLQKYTSLCPLDDDRSNRPLTGNEMGRVPTRHFTLPNHENHHRDRTNMLIGNSDTHSALMPASHSNSTRAVSLPACNDNSGNRHTHHLPPNLPTGQSFSTATARVELQRHPTSTITPIHYTSRSVDVTDRTSAGIRTGGTSEQDTGIECSQRLAESDIAAIRPVSASPLLEQH